MSEPLRELPLGANLVRPKRLDARWMMLVILALPSVLSCGPAPNDDDATPDLSCLRGYEPLAVLDGFDGDVNPSYSPK